MRHLTTLARCMALLVAGVMAAGGSQGKGNSKGKGGKAHVEVGVQIFIGKDRGGIREYVSKLPSDQLPPGLAKRGGSLPPGLAKQLRKNGKLPPGLQKRLHTFPVELEKRLRCLSIAF